MVRIAAISYLHALPFIYKGRSGSVSRQGNFLCGIPSGKALQISYKVDTGKKEGSQDFWTLALEELKSKVRR